MERKLSRSTKPGSLPPPLHPAARTTTKPAQPAYQAMPPQAAKFVVARGALPQQPTPAKPQQNSTSFAQQQQPVLARPLSRTTTFQRESQSLGKAALDKIREEIAQLEETVKDKSSILQGQKAINTDVARDLDKANKLHNDIIKSTSDVLKENDEAERKIKETKDLIERNTRAKNDLERTLETVRQQRQNLEETANRADEVEAQMRGRQAMAQSHMQLATEVLPRLIGLRDRITALQANMQGGGNGNQMLGQRVRQQQEQMEEAGLNMGGGGESEEESEDFENDNIPLDAFERIEMYRWDPESSDPERLAIDECKICYYPFVELEKIKRLGCKHQFHSRCLKTWTRRNRDCPTCNRRIVIPR